MHCLHHPLVGLDLQTQGAAEGLDVMGESWRVREGNRIAPLYTEMLLRDNGEQQQQHLCVWGSREALDHAETRPGGAQNSSVSPSSG